MFSRISVLVVPFALVTLAACAGSSAEETVGESEGAVTAGTKVLEAKLYADPTRRPSPSCDQYTQLTVTAARGDAFDVLLEDKLAPTSGCEILVMPNPRRVRVSKSTECGSTVYAGTQNGISMRVQDNRRRTCEDLRPATLEVSVRDPRGSYELYGQPVASRAPAARVDAGSAQVSTLLDVKLYPEPGGTGMRGCDRYTKLSLGREGSRLVATFRDELSPTSGCEILVVPNERSYEVTASDECGSKVYSGRSGADSVRVQDNRTRTCEDLRADVVEVTERRGGRTETAFGRP